MRRMLALHVRVTSKGADTGFHVRLTPAVTPDVWTLWLERCRALKAPGNDQHMLKLAKDHAARRALEARQYYAQYA